MRGDRPGAISILDRRLEKPLLALQVALTGDALIKAVFRVLKAAVRCDFLNACLRFVRLEGGNMAYRMIDSRGCEFGLDLLEDAFFTAHPGMPTLMANPGIRFINTREILAPDEILHETRFYREVMQVIGFRHAVGMFFWDTPPQVPEAIFSLCRVAGQPDFDDAEVALLDRLYPHLAAAFHRVRASENERAVRKELHALTQHALRAACILDWDLQIADANRAALESCAQWNLGAEHASRLKPPSFQLPVPLREACAELKAHWCASLRENPVAGAAERRVVAHPQRAGWRATISMHVRESTPLGKPGFLVEFEQNEATTAAAKNSAFKSDRRSPGLDALTSRERELVRLVCTGRSNQEIADQTRRALGSVKNALHAIFKKLEVHSRAGLIAAVRLLPLLLPALSADLSDSFAAALL